MHETNMYPTPLAARVAATNISNAYAMECWDKLASVFRPYVGQKIRKADGTLLKRIADALPNLDTQYIKVYRESSHYSVSFTIRATCYTPDPRDKTYPKGYQHQTTIYIGDTNPDDHILKRIADKPTGIKTDYKVEDVEAARERYRKAAKVYEAAKSALFPFDEYDR